MCISIYIYVQYIFDIFQDFLTLFEYALDGKKTKNGRQWLRSGVLLTVFEAKLWNGTRDENQFELPHVDFQEKNTKELQSGVTVILLLIKGSVKSQ